MYLTDSRMTIKKQKVVKASKKDKINGEVEKELGRNEVLEIEGSDHQGKVLKAANSQGTEPKSAEVPEGTITSTETGKLRTFGGKRSICAMHKVVVKKAQGKKIKVRYNERGDPVGETRHTLQSYIGMLGRTMVPTEYILSWPKVDAEMKERLWNDVQVNYISSLFLYLLYFIFISFEFYSSCISVADGL